jgi:hypothetical protein
MKCKTKRTSLRRTLTSIYAWCRRHRHLPIETQHAALCRRVQGHFNYFAVSGNFRSLLLVVEGAKRAWYEWLRRRSQRTRLTGERFDDLLRQHPLPTPRITIQIWGPTP